MSQGNFLFIPQLWLAFGVFVYNVYVFVSPFLGASKIFFFAYREKRKR